VSNEGVRGVKQFIGASGPRRLAKDLAAFGDPGAASDCSATANFKDFRTRSYEEGVGT
jgi:hypothetical protein